MAILSRDHTGAPRLLRAVALRPSAAGMAASLAARDHIAALASLWVPSGQAMPLVDAGSQQLRNGATVVRLAQQIDGVVVRDGELRVLLHANGALAAVSGTLLPVVVAPVFTSSSIEAVDRALDRMYGPQRVRPAIDDTGEQHGWHVLSVAADPQLRITSARARRELVSMGSALVAAWAIELLGDAPPDPRGDPSMSVPAARRILLADAGGKLLRDTNLIDHDAFVYRAYAETAGNRRPLDSAHSDVMPHPTGVPDGTTATPIPANLVTMEAFNRPVDPWLPANAITTAGNNVEAFADRDGDGEFTPGDVRPEVRGGRVLNFQYDHRADPFATPDQAKAAVVNAFFVANWLHDFWYDSGFTEVTGNAQLDNYERGGAADDRLLVVTQFGASTGLRNNASAAVPADGVRPSIAIRIYTPLSSTTLVTPIGPVTSEAFTMGPRAFELTGDLVAAIDGVTPFGDACQPLTHDVAGKIALVVFSGACGSVATVNAIKAAGATAIILADGVNENPRAFAGSAAANLPGLAIGKSGGEALLAALAAGPVTVTLTSEEPAIEREGGLDNGLIAHEFAHYLHRRLADCDAPQCTAMSEGWGDFNGLMMALRDDDSREGTFAHGDYTELGRTPNGAYFGSRRFPYSLDRRKNALSFRHIADGEPLPDTPISVNGLANSEIHNAGEVWASMMWEVLHILIDEHGLQIARRRMADYVVAGLLLTPPNATFTEGRDAILSAASALDSDDMVLMAAAFAGRGAGSCAVSPDVSVLDNTGVIESGTIAAKLSIGGLALVDDGVSCDRDGYLDPGESGQLRFTVANAGPLAAEALTITATTTATGVRLGAPIRIAAMQPFSSASLAIPVTVLPAAARDRELAISVHAAADTTCDRGGLTATLATWMGADDVADAVRIDRVDPRITAWTPSGTSAGALWSIATAADRNRAWFGVNANFTSDTQLTSPILQVSPSEPFIVQLAHAYSFEAADERFDGGVIEVSSDGGATWADVTDLGVDPGYTGPLAEGSDNPLAGREAFALASPGFPARAPLVLDFGTRLAGRAVQLRFRIGTDATTASLGWELDDIEVSGIVNTPFPARVAEPSACTARSAAREVSAVVTTEQAPATSLEAFNTDVCIASED